MWYTILLIIVIVTVPIVVNYALYWSFPPTPSDLGNKEWLGFWASFLGGAIGGVATLMAITLTLKQNLDNHNQLIKKQDDIYHKNINLGFEKTRLELIPFLNVKVISHSKDICNSGELYNAYDYPSGYIHFHSNKATYSYDIEEKLKLEILESNDRIENLKMKLGEGIRNKPIKFDRAIEIENIGNGAAVEIEYVFLSAENEKKDEILTNISRFHLNKNDTQAIRFIFSENNLGKDYIMLAKYKDITLMNEYIQDINLRVANDTQFAIHTGKPKLTSANTARPKYTPCSD